MGDGAFQHEIYSVLADPTLDGEVVAELAALEIREHALGDGLAWVLMRREIADPKMLEAIEIQLSRVVNDKWIVPSVFSMAILSNAGRDVVERLQQFRKETALSSEQAAIVDVVMEKARKSIEIEFSDIEDLASLP